jgi:predicted  nucleic acid-binding Zn-ribbon protein
MLKELPKLYDLQQLDIQIGQLQQRRNGLTQSHKIARQIEELKRNLSRQERKLQEIEAQYDRKKIELQSLWEQREVEEKRLETVELDFTEMSNLRSTLDRLADQQEKVVADIRRIDGERTHLKEDLQHKAERLAELEAHWAEVQAEEELEARIIEEEIAELMAQRDVLVREVSAPSLQRYERTREHCENLAIVQVENDVCPGCRMVLTPSIVRQLEEGRKVQFCPNCRRILYWPGGRLTLVAKPRLSSRRRS